MSKKTIKLVSVLLVVMMGVMMVGTSVFAASIGNVNVTANTSGTSNIATVGRSIIGILQVVGILAAVIILMVLGIKYMMGSAEEKAEYKKTMIPYVIGAVLIFAAATIVNVVYQFATGLSV